MNELLEIDDILREIDSISAYTHNSRSGLCHQRLQKIRAGQADDELAQICYLIDSHVPSLRERAAMRYEKLIMKSECEESKERLQMLKDLISTRCYAKIEDHIDEIKKQVAEMPTEWTIVQLTLQYNPKEHQNLDAKRYHISGLHISVFNCGQDKTNPFLVTVDPPSIGGNKLELLQELMDTIEEHKQRLEKTAKRKYFKNRKEKYDYIYKSGDAEAALKGIVKKTEENWLREWSCLLIGKYQDDSVECRFRTEIDNMLKCQLHGIHISERSKGLLYQIIKGAAYLQGPEILKAVQYCLKDIEDPNTIKDIARSIKEVSISIENRYENLPRHPVILVVDECLDSVPWEMMEVLNGEPVSRVPSLHFAYFLFKIHEKDIEKGHKIINNYKNGKYIVNPDRDLNQMETRMMTFYNYWLQNWNGINDRKPTSEEFYDLLKTADIFSYSGHGNGTHIVPIEMLQKIQVNAVVLLFGCASTRIARLSTQVEMYGSYHMYIISQCPCVLGMLWPVTDIYTDVLTTEFLSIWLPSEAPVSWSDVDKEQWKKAVECDTFTAGDKDSSDKRLNELELLRALSQSKKRTEHYLTKAACVVRGLPVKIKEI